MSTNVEKATNLFSQGFSCSQAIFAGFCEDYGLSQEEALKISSSFGGGLGGKRELCGLVSGALMVIGLHNGRIRGDDMEGKAINYQCVNEFLKKFEDHFGSTTCKTLLEGFMNSSNPSLYNKSCANLTEEAANLLETILSSDKYRK